MECPICADRKRNVKTLSCPSATCDFSCCSDCVKTQLRLSKTPVYCMNPECKQEWNRFWFGQHFSQTFMANEYKFYRERVLEEEERSRFPETRSIIDMERVIDKLRVREVERLKDLDNVRIEKGKLYDEAPWLSVNLDSKYDEAKIKKRWKITDAEASNYSNLVLLARIRATSEEKKEYQTRLHRIYEKEWAACNAVREIMALRERANAEYTLANNVEEKPDATLKNRCMASDCVGSLNYQWRCELCNRRWCSECHEFKCYLGEVDEHECDSQILASVNLLKQDSKNCPKCQALIHRESGCATMWCTRCHVFFDWRTLKITERAHNPHYQEWQQQHNNQAVAAVGCVQEVTPEIIRGLKQAEPALLESIDRMWKSHETARQMAHDNQPAALLAKREADLRKERLTLLRAEGKPHYTDTFQKWKVTIQRIDKKLSLDYEMSQVYDMYYRTCAILLVNLRDAPSKERSKVIKEYEALVKYVTGALMDVRKVYNSSRHLHL